MVIVGGDKIRHGLHRRDRIGHRHAHACKPDHGFIVPAIAAGHQVRGTQAKALEQQRQRGGFLHAQRHGLDEKRRRTVNGQPSRKFLLHQFLHVGHIHRVAHQQQLVDGIGHVGGQVLHPVHRDAVDAGFLQHVGIVRILGDDAVLVIGQRHHVPILGKQADLGDEVCREGMLHQRFTGFAVNDLATVVAQDAAAAAGQLQLLRQRLDAHRGAAAGQHDGGARIGGIQKCLSGARGNHFVTVGQSSVQIQRQYSIGHGVTSFSFSFFLLYRKVLCCARRICS